VQIRAQVSLGFQAEPYSPEIRATAVEQHRALVAAVVDGDGELAAQIATQHFSLTEGALRKLLDRVQEEPA
jgi:DNA-binding GntR family transcriptional regulator